MTARLPLNRQYDIFCKVVDNFGDIGVCWRLARQLVDEHNVSVRLWVDDQALATRFAGDDHDGIQLHHWTERADFGQAATVVIETFSCGLPESYQSAMFVAQSLWLNIDYLSAEDWVEDFHGKPSPQANGLIRWFFYPGFTLRTGGLLREVSLPGLQADAAMQADAFWQHLGCTPAATGQMTLSLFCYAHAPLAALLQAFAHSPQPIRLLLPDSIAPMVANVLSLAVLRAGQRVQHGACEICVIPFLSQPDYDRLLSLCDVNFVRGEDSWVRAIWAGKPMVWLPYQQTDETHLQKLAAFLRHYLALAKPEVAAVIQDMMQAWANGSFECAHWAAFTSHYSEVSRHSMLVASQLAKTADLVTNMVIFIEKLQENRV
ncbi:elongation factor P maturation arginine rhamnosyltransferase EarP [Methylophilus aquaticus]|uniref:Protein-arginine rhamnosyltransferase n=1 Tax=Methylophilus aquaticus TaxID=1971610 RepID=A0ABT9JT23_9PROT|nr:elongation factor P maturation arginine rhamnosyltransferase EarP [Methylophilus aquaticus]MDP8567265.1 elongation factor P maturation arginine rhamnosyltransferase EarP [Methylophilus aquaticus]